MKFQQWQDYVFWDKLKEQLPVPLPEGLAGYNTYTSKGLPPGPISSPSIASIDAALAPDTKDGYLFFIAKGDGSRDQRLREDARRARQERREVRQELT